MQPGHETLVRGRSPFAAAFLSLLFPGLGHVYLGADRRGLGFAAPPLLFGALVAGFAVRMSVVDLGGLALQQWFQVAVFVGNLLLLVYRAAAIFDAWSIARLLNGRPGVSAAAVRQAGLISVAGLAAVLLVMSGAHVAVARYDLLLSTTSACIFDPQADCSDDPTGSAEPTEEATERPAGTTPEPSAGPAVSGPTIPQWDGRERLNILLVGVDEQGGGFNTDTMITVSIDPATKQVVMFQLPRDTVDVPLPPGPVRGYYGAVYPGKINSFAANGNRTDWFPGGKTNHIAGLNGLKAILGNLYGLDIKYFVQVNFEGFREVVDALGGVTVNVQVPVLDDNFPQPGGRRERLFVPAGVQHMTGREALEFARSRKSTSDFERGARQQRVIVSLRQQLDVGSALRKIDVLAAAIGDSVRTDVPRELVPQLLGLAEEVDTRSIRSVTFTPPFYQVECLNCPPRGYIIQPRVERIRAAVAEAFNVDPAFAETRDALLQEGAEVWVLNGTGRNGEAARLSEYLSYLGIAASAPNQRPDVDGLPATTIRVYNGAETELPLTFEALKLVFGVEPTPVTDPAVRIDFEVITGSSTPQLTPPPAP
ncbi:MAG TPA: LCP family protein [Candidatus Limnocylindria bacterium]|nr:LCP family protein [Candidatus Limnocylindria bacterium]